MDIERQKRLMDIYKVGYVKNPETPDPVILEFRELTQKFRDQGYFKANLMFYFLHFMQLIILEAFAFYVSYYYKLTSWTTTLACAIALMVCQVCGFIYLVLL